MDTSGNHSAFPLPHIPVLKGRQDCKEVHRKAEVKCTAAGKWVTVIYWNGNGGGRFALHIQGHYAMRPLELTMVKAHLWHCSRIQKTVNNKTRTNCTKFKTHSKMKIGNDFNKAMNTSAEKTPRRGESSLSWSTLLAQEQIAVNWPWINSGWRLE